MNVSTNDLRNGMALNLPRACSPWSEFQHVSRQRWCRTTAPTLRRWRISKSSSRANSSSVGPWASRCSTRAKASSAICGGGGHPVDLAGVL